MKIHYFQRYHSKENVDTANTMLMLSRLYNYNPDKFFLMLNNLILKENSTPELSFELQSSNNKSVPDAVISQQSFKVVVETKLYNEFDLDQLLNHLTKFNNEEIKVLLTLDPKPMKKDFYDRFQVKLDEYNAKNKMAIKHINITFNDLIKAMEDIIDERDTDIFAILEDFKDYCLYEDLLPDKDKWLRAITSGTTFEDNIDLNMYYDQSSRGFTDHGYIGLYKDKRINAIGKIKKIIKAVYKDDKLVCSTVEGEDPLPNEIENIEEAIKRSSNYGYDLRNIEHNYFIVDNFVRTNFIKASKYPLFRTKLFNLTDILKTDKLPSTEEIAKILDGKTWEEMQ